MGDFLGGVVPCQPAKNPTNEKGPYMFSNRSFLKVLFNLIQSESDRVSMWSSSQIFTRKLLLYPEWII